MALSRDPRVAARLFLIVDKVEDLLQRADNLAHWQVRWRGA
jgi:hypothetical protein